MLQTDTIPGRAVSFLARRQQKGLLESILVQPTVPMNSFPCCPYSSGHSSVFVLDKQKSNFL